MKTIKPRNNIIRAMIEDRKYGGPHTNNRKSDLMKVREQELLDELNDNMEEDYYDNE